MNKIAENIMNLTLNEALDKAQAEKQQKKAASQDVTQQLEKLENQTFHDPSNNPQNEEPPAN